MITLLAIAVALILGNALYVAAEFAVLAARVTQIQQHAVAGSAVAAGLVPVVSNTRRLDTYIAVCQIGITVTSLALGAFGQATFGIMPDLPGLLCSLSCRSTWHACSWEHDPISHPRENR